MSAEQIVLELMQEWLEAHKVGDANIIAPMLADSYINTDENGTVTTKHQVLEMISQVRFQGGMHELSARNYGNTVIVTGVIHAEGTFKGEPFTANLRQTSVWILTPPGHWRCVAGHQSTLAPVS